VITSIKGTKELTLSIQINKEPEYLIVPPTVIQEYINRTQHIYSPLKYIRFCPYGQPGDRLWVRETFADLIDIGGGHNYCAYKADLKIDSSYEDHTHWTPSIFMPRWASRITLEITGVRVERVRDITPEDAYQEGMVHNITASEADCLTPFRELWDSINAKRGYGWDVNPWVWVIGFRRIIDNEKESRPT
jgi:hypothetical protein